MYCSKCGSRLENGAGFCSDCGASVNELTTPDETARKVFLERTDTAVVNQVHDAELSIPVNKMSMSQLIPILRKGAIEAQKIEQFLGLPRMPIGEGCAVYGMVFFIAAVLGVLGLCGVPGGVLVFIGIIVVFGYCIALIIWAVTYRASNELKLKKAVDAATTLALLPPDYRSSLACSTMISLINNGRATTWKELADKVEEQIHRWTVESNTAEAAAYAKSAANWGKANALFSAAHFIRHF